MTLSSRMTRTRLRALAILAGLGVALTSASAVAPPQADAALAYGPYTCKPGFVWRDAWWGDQVCVTPADRSAVVNENTVYPSRTSSVGSPRWCLSGFVWREATWNDYVCTPPASRDRERYNNTQPVYRLEDSSRTPQGGGYISRVNRYQTGFYVSVAGSGFSPYARVSVYSVNTTYTRWGPYKLGTVNAAANGSIASTQLNSMIAYQSAASEPTVIVMHDERSGKVTTAGSTWAIRP